MSTSLTSGSKIDQPPGRRFMTTRWSLVVQARGTLQSAEAQRALSELCETYWLPLYAFVRRRIHDVDKAQDLTQAFFARLLEKQYLADVRPERGRFRSFLLTAVKNFLSNERDRERAQKRGGHLTIQSLDWQLGEQHIRREPVEHMTAERVFEREWALALLDRVLERLKAEHASPEKQLRFQVLSRFLSVDRSQINYADAAVTLNMTEDAARVATHRLRRRYRSLLRDEVAHTTSDPGEIDDEIQALFAALA